MKRYLLLVAVVGAATAWSAIGRTAEGVPKKSLKIRADSKCVNVEMVGITATARELTYDQDQRSLVLSGSRENPVRAIQDQPYNLQMALVAEQFTISLETGSVRVTGLPAPPAVLPPRYQK